MFRSNPTYRRTHRYRFEKADHRKNQTNKLASFALPWAVRLLAGLTTGERSRFRLLLGRGRGQLVPERQYSSLACSEIDVRGREAKTDRRTAESTELDIAAVAAHAHVNGNQRQIIRGNTCSRFLVVLPRKCTPVVKEIHQVCKYSVSWFGPFWPGRAEIIC